jgi:hypothetical protein
LVRVLSPVARLGGGGTLDEGVEDDALLLVKDARKSGDVCEVVLVLVATIRRQGEVRVGQEVQLKLASLTCDNPDQLLLVMPTGRPKITVTYLDDTFSPNPAVVNVWIDAGPSLWNKK